MTRLRTSLPVLAGLAALLAAPAAAAQGAASGGADAPLRVDGRDGGVMAPGTEPETDAQTGAVPAQPAQEPTPTVPEGEQQPDGEQPADPDEPTSDEPTDDGTDGTDDGTVPPVDQVPPTSGEEPASEGADTGSALGFLPSTGLEVAALVLIGLGLTLAGFALRPRRRVRQPAS